MIRKDFAGAALGAAALVMAFAAPAASQQQRVQAGTLECSL